MSPSDKPCLITVAEAGELYIEDAGRRIGRRRRDGKLRVAGTYLPPDSRRSVELFNAERALRSTSDAHARRAAGRWRTWPQS